MSKKLTFMLMVIAIGVFTALGATANAQEYLSVFSTNSGHASGTFINPGGKGDALIFPYYDVREINGKEQDTYFAIINDEGECEVPTSECRMGMAAKLRFREFDKSEEVFDVEIWMSRADVWVGVLTHNTSLALPLGTRITSPDFVITDFNATTFTVGTPLAGGFDFPATGFIPPNSSNLMGYFEVIGSERTFDTQSGGKVNRLTSGTVGGSDADAPNELMGYAYLVRPVDGVSLAYNATAIAYFSRTQTLGTPLHSLFTGLGTVSPNLKDCQDTLDELEFQMSKEEVFAGYSIEDVFLGKFSLVLTFPTKHYHFCGNPNYTVKTSVGSPLACPDTFPEGMPWLVFNPPIGSVLNTANTPEPIDVTIFDRNENRLIPQKTFFSPPPVSPSVGLPWEVNIIGLYKVIPPTVPAVGLRDNVALSTGTPGFDSGYINVEFPEFGTTVSRLNPKISAFQNYGRFFRDYDGLPVLGLALQEFSNGNVGGFYGDIRPVFYESDRYGLEPIPGG